MKDNIIALLIGLTLSVIYIYGMEHLFIEVKVTNIKEEGPLVCYENLEWMEEKWKSQCKKLKETISKKQFYLSLYLYL